MAISLTIQGGTTINGIPYTNQMNVQNAIEKAYDIYTNPPNIPPLSFAIEYYGTYNGSYLGYMVTQLDGTAQQGSMYWALYINGVVAANGIDETILNDGDQISFQYQSYSEQTHGRTVLAHIEARKKARG